MSPEQVNAEKIDKLTDIYSLGVTLFYMAVGKPPYENSNALKIGIKIISETFPEAKNFYPGVSEKIERIISKATQKKKKDRYQSCEEFKKDLNTPLKIVSQKNISKPEKTRNLKQVSLLFFLGVLLLIGIGMFGFIVYSDIDYKKWKSLQDAAEKSSVTLEEEEEEEAARMEAQEEAEYARQNNKEDKDTSDKLDKPEEVITDDKSSNNAESKKVYIDNIWECLKPALLNSNIEDKDLILRLLEMYSDKNKREQAIYNLADTYTSLYDIISICEAEFLISTEDFTDKEEDLLATKEEKGVTHFIQRGETNFNSENYKAAINAFTKAINIDPNSASSYNWRALSYYRLDDVVNLDAAIKDFTKAIILDPKESVYYFNRGDSHYQSGNFKDAIDDFERAINLDPNDDDYYNMRALSYYMTEDFNAALKDFTNAINLNPNEGAYYSNRGDSHNELGRSKRAIDDFGRAINLDPNNDEYYNIRGIAYFMSENYAQAITDFTKAINLNPNNGAYYYNRASSNELLNLFYCNDYRMGCVLGHTDSCEIYETDCQ